MKSILDSQATDADLDRFWSYVDKAGVESCWPWLMRLSHGYGRFTIRHGLTIQAHRVAYELTVGRIPAGLVIDHLCRNPCCVNPSHLEPVTSLENVRRGIAPSAERGRQTHCRQGHPFDTEGTKIRKQGWRVCRACHREKSRGTTARRRAKRRSEGLCLWCPKPVIVGRPYCESCAEKKLWRDRQRHQAMLAERSAKVGA